MSAVALFTRAWIEMAIVLLYSVIKVLSPSSRGRGLKSIACCVAMFWQNVALFTRAWIEIISSSSGSTLILVALFTRAWIEISCPYCFEVFTSVALFTRAWIEIIRVAIAPDLLLSPSSRGRGLKYRKNRYNHVYRYVALFTRAWIEIEGLLYTLRVLPGRPLHEGVD